MKTSQTMANNSQLPFRLKITVLELITKTKIPSTEPMAASSISSINAIDYTARTIDMFDVDHTNIVYRAEGNANIVLALPQTCQVLRLPKFSGSDQNICHSTAKKKNLSIDRIFYVQKYITSVSPLFGQNLSDRPMLVRIEFHNIEAFSVWLHNLRPFHRINSDKTKDLHFEYGLLYRDACILNIKEDNQSLLFRSIDSYAVYAVEIKPKQGWHICRLSSPLLQSFGIDAMNDRHKCGYCAMQYLKMKRHTVHELSKYCPMDLFSGVMQRMEYALHNLITFPQNNFRLFINGKLVYTDTNRIEDLHRILNGCCFSNESRSSMDAFVSLLINILRYDFVLNRKCEWDQISVIIISVQHLSECVDTNPTYFPEHSILNYVLKLQLLTQETISYVAEKYSLSSFNEFFENENWPHLHVHDLNRKLNQFDCNRISPVSYEYLNAELNLHHYDMYEIGATALDSSIMLTFQKTDQNISSGTPSITVDGQTFSINAKVFDLDPKLHFTHFKKYAEKTRESYEAYAQFKATSTSMPTNSVT